MNFIRDSIPERSFAEDRTMVAGIPSTSRIGEAWRSLRGIAGRICEDSTEIFYPYHSFEHRLERSCWNSSPRTFLDSEQNSPENCRGWYASRTALPIDGIVFILARGSRAAFIRDRRTSFRIAEFPDERTRRRVDKIELFIQNLRNSQ